MSPCLRLSSQSAKRSAVFFALAQRAIADRWRRSRAFWRNLAPPSRRPASITPTLCNSWSEAMAAPLILSLSSTWRSSAVDRQVPMMEQCRLVPNSQMRVRRAVCAAMPSGSPPSSPLSCESVPSFTISSGRTGRGTSGAGCKPLVESSCKPLVESIWASLNAMRGSLYLDGYSDVSTLSGRKSSGCLGIALAAAVGAGSGRSVSAAIPESDDLDLIARAGRWGEWLSADQAVGLGKRQNHSAVLLGEGVCEEPPFRVCFKMRPHIIFAPVVFRQARCENCPVKARIRVVQSKHRPHGGTQEQQSADERRYRISRHAQDRQFAEPSEHQRFTRTHRDLPEFNSEPAGVQ